MKSNIHGKLRKYIEVGLVGFATIINVQAQIVQPNLTDIVDYFPHTSQGENGIYLQYRELPGSVYYNLVNTADQAFEYTAEYNSIPQIGVDPEGTNWVFAAPSAADFAGDPVVSDAVIRVTLNGTYGQVAVQGSTFDLARGAVEWYIYKGESNYNNPIWSTSDYTQTSYFNLLVNYCEGDQLFFAVKALGGSDISDWSIWTIQFQAAAPPSASPLPPYIVTTVGDSATITDVASGSLPIAYQWLFDNAPITNATNASFVIASTSPTNVGLYSVIITNSFGAITNGPTALWLTKVQPLPVLFIYGPQGSNCAVQSSTNLTPPTIWTPLTNLNVQSSPVFFLDSNVISNPSEFFLVVPD